MVVGLKQTTDFAHRCDQALLEDDLDGQASGQRCLHASLNALRISAHHGNENGIDFGYGV